MGDIAKSEIGRSAAAMARRISAKDMAWLPMPPLTKMDRADIYDTILPPLRRNAIVCRHFFEGCHSPQCRILGRTYQAYSILSRHAGRFHMRLPLDAGDAPSPDNSISRRSLRISSPIAAPH